MVVLSPARPWLIDAYVAREVAGPGAVAVFGFAIILISSLLFDLSDLIFVKHVPAALVLRMLGYKVPHVVELSLPVAVLFGALMGMGRLQKDGELTVMRACGQPFWRLALPILACGALASAADFALSEWIVPASNHRYEDLVRQLLFEDPVPQLQADVFFKGPQGQVFYIGKIDERRRVLERVMIFEPDVNGFPREITARRGTYSAHAWHLEDGVLRQLDAQGFVRVETRFQKLDYPMQPHFEQLFGEQRTTDEMSRAQLAQEIAQLRRSGLDVTPFVVDYALKWAQPWVSLLFAVAGAPLALGARRGGRAYGVVIALSMAFGYYALEAVARALGNNELLPPLLAGWATNGLFALLGAWLWWQADRV